MIDQFADPNLPMYTKRVMLEAVRFATKTRVDPCRFLSTAELHSYVDHETRDMVLGITTTIYGTEEQRTSVSYPADWWEAFKDRWFPVWLLKRCPVRRTTTELRGRLIFPDLPYEMTGKPREWFELETIDWRSSNVGA